MKKIDDVMWDSPEKNVNGLIKNWETRSGHKFYKRVPQNGIPVEPYERIYTHTNDAFLAEKATPEF